MIITNPAVTDEILQLVSRELGIDSLDEGAQAAFVSGVGENIMGQVMLEIYRILPPAKHDEFAGMIGTATPARVLTYLAPYVSDMPALISRVAKQEIEETKRLLAEG